MGCYIRLANGGRIALAGGSGFLLLTDCVVTPDPEPSNNDRVHQGFIANVGRLLVR